MGYMQKYEQWISNEYFDEDTRQELLSIKNNEKEIEDRFYKDLEFGTGGLRGVMGVGTNRMNKYTVTKATQGLANYIIKNRKEKRGVVIAYDSRNNSKEFGNKVALCLNANGIKTYLFESLRPTPELSYAVKKLGCIAGIVVTASHNPPKYNGYKVYWEDGAQITSPIDKKIITEVNNIENYNQVKTISKEEAIKRQLYNIIGEEIDKEYIETIKKLILNKECINEYGKKLKIVYTPLHGTGNIPVRRILKELGFENVFVVPEQELPNGNFPTVDYPNPEDPNAFCLALELAKQKEADLVLATDPDADRLGVYAKNQETGEYESFTGNMSGLLIAEYILSQKKQKNEIPKNGAIVKTIVSSNMVYQMAKKYEISVVEVLTGFKYIGEQIKLFEQNNSYKYLFGYEESYGCLIGTYARDKDAVSAVMALCETAAYCKSKGLTLCEQRDNLYKEYGYYKEELFSVTLEGTEGRQKIQKIMEKFRNNPPYTVANYKVKAIRDYKNSVRKQIINNKQNSIDLPKSNVIYFELEKDAWLCVRPSGTEPKIKFYYGVREDNDIEATINLEMIQESVKKMIE